MKLFLNLSKDEQRERFLARIDEPEKNWKFSAADARERQFWDDYQVAYSEMLSHTSTEHAPWHVIPADHKWFARIAASAIIADALMAIDPRFPTVSDETRADLIEMPSAALEERAHLMTHDRHGPDSPSRPRRPKGAAAAAPARTYRAPRTATGTRPPTVGIPSS